jgi:hypothetical protein
MSCIKKIKQSAEKSEKALRNPLFLISFIIHNRNSSIRKSQENKKKIYKKTLCDQHKFNIIKVYYFYYIQG